MWRYFWYDLVKTVAFLMWVATFVSPLVCAVVVACNKGNKVLYFSYLICMSRGAMGRTKIWSNKEPTTGLLPFKITAACWSCSVLGVRCGWSCWFVVCCTVCPCAWLNRSAMDLAICFFEVYNEFLASNSNTSTWWSGALSSKSMPDIKLLTLVLLLCWWPSDSSNHISPCFACRTLSFFFLFSFFTSDKWSITLSISPARARSQTSSSPRRAPCEPIWACKKVTTWQQQIY